GVGTTTGVVWSFTTLPLPGAASAPSPANAATLVPITSTLSWTAGSNAASHDVRFGTANPPPFVVNQTATTYNPGTLTANTTYHRGTHPNNGSGTTTGTVWSFTTLPLPGAAGAPSPANAATGVSISATLSWTAGSNTASHNVNFGAANPPPFLVNQTGTTY